MLFIISSLCFAIRARNPVDYPGFSAWRFIRRSILLSVSQWRSLRSIELPYKKALVTANAWASLYLNGFKRIKKMDVLSIQAIQRDTQQLAAFTAFTIMANYYLAR